MFLIKILNRLTKSNQTDSRKESRFSTRLLKLESLEERQLLSVNIGKTPAPSAGFITQEILDNQDISATANSLNNALPTSADNSITVTNANSTGEGSLAHAIETATAGTTIVFNSNLSAETIFLTGTLTIDKAITIDATSVATPITITINGSRHFDISNTEGTVTIKNFNFTQGSSDGSTGGSIRKTKAGTLALENITFRANNALYGGALANGPDSTVTITNCDFTGNSAQNGYGGAIHNSGTMTINNVSFNGNDASYGGAISNDGSLTLEYNTKSVTFTDNRATTSGGAIFNYYTTGTKSRSGVLTINTNTSQDPTATFIGNESRINGGAITNFAQATINSSYFESNDFYSDTSEVIVRKGGAIYNGADQTPDTSFGLTLNNVKFIENAQSSLEFDILGGALYNALNSNATIINTQFENNGLSSNSGYSVTGGAIFNLGAIELETGNSFSSNKAWKGGAIFNSGNLDIAESNSFSDNEAGIQGGAICNTYFKYDNNAYRGILTITGTTQNPVEFTNNTANTGGAIGNWGAATIDYASFGENTAALNGGAVYNDKYISSEISDAQKATLSISNSTFTSNSAFRGGALVAATESRVESVSVTSCTFTGNTAQNNGGAIFTACPNFTITGSTFTGNTAQNSGGAILNYGTLTLSGRNTFTGNTADVNGGAINNAVIGSRKGNLTITADDNTNVSAFSTNSAKGNGGAISNWGIANITYATFTENIVFDESSNVSKGGAIFNSNAEGTSVALNLCIFEKNFACYGGAFFNQDGSSNVTLQDVSFTENGYYSEKDLYAYGGAIYNLATMEAAQTTFEKNKGINGGAIWNGGSLEIAGSFTSNYATAYGGAIQNAYIDATTQLTISDESSFYYNKAGTGGGAISNYISATIGAVTFKGNEAPKGGAIYNNNLSQQNSGPNLSISGSSTGFTFEYNFSNYGGAIYNETNGSVSLANGKFNYNKVTALVNKSDSGYGGAIYNLGTVDIDYHTDPQVVLFSNNFAPAGGGAILNSGTLDILDTVFTENKTEKNGGAIFNSGSATIDADFTKNQANDKGGAIFNTQDSSNPQSMILQDSFFEENKAGFGGGVANIGTLTVDGCTFYMNYAENATEANGGAITSGSLTTLPSDGVPTASLTFSGSYTSITHNTADNLGGGLVLMADTTCTITDGIYDSIGNGTLAIEDNQTYRFNDVSEDVLTYIIPKDQNGNEVTFPNSVNLSGLTNISILKGSSTELTSSGISEPEYAIDINGDGKYEVKTKKTLTADSLGLNVGTHTVSMAILVNNTVRVTFETTITIESNQVSATSSTTGFMNNQLVALSINVQPTCRSISQWVVNWGDNEESIVEAGTKSFTALHLYNAGEADQTNPITLSFIDENGVRNSQPYFVTNHTVPTTSNTEPETSYIEPAFGGSDYIDSAFSTNPYLSELPNVAGGEVVAVSETGISPSVLTAPLDVENFIGYENTPQSKSAKPVTDDAETDDALIDTYWQNFDDESETNDFSFDFGNEYVTDEEKDSTFDESLLEAIF
ncbi:MAG: hypothetical protein Q4C95_06045 [Planctomycetia bacterium]|nr:hypothetical protein [Planctomycetia bacterium]